MPFPIGLQYINKLEIELAVLFPEKFKAKMALENGGEILTAEDEWELYPFFDESDKKRIGRTCNHIGLETKQARKWGNFPSNAVAIASNGCGDCLILLPFDDGSKNLKEEIYLWLHENGKAMKIASSIYELT